MSKQKILPVEPLIQCEAGRAKTMQRQSLYSPRTPKWSNLESVAPWSGFQFARHLGKPTEPGDELSAILVSQGL